MRAGADPEKVESRVARQGLWTAILVFAAYYFGAKLGFRLTISPNPISVLWPPNSLLLGAMLVVPPRRWWIVFAAALPAHWLAQMERQVPASMIACWYISNCSEALLASGLLILTGGFPFRFKRLSDLGRFLLFGGIVAPVVSSFIDAAFIEMNRFSVENFWSIIRVRSPSNILSELVFVPPIVMAAKFHWRSIKEASFERACEVILLSLTLIGVCAFVFIRDDNNYALTAPYLYAPLPWLLWAALRFGLGGAGAGSLVVSISAIWGAVHGKGPLIGSSSEQTVLSVQLFLISVSVYQLALGVILDRQKTAHNELRGLHQRYREVLDNQTDLLCRYLPDMTLTYVNASCCKTFGRPANLIIGRSFLEFMKPPGGAQMSAAIASLLNEQRTVTLELQTLERNGNSPSWIQWVNSIVTDSKGITEIQAIGHDVSDRKAAEEIRQELAHVSRLAVMGELSAMIAHEIKQPLGAILSNAEAAEMLLDREEVPWEEVRQILADIRDDDLRTNDAIQRIRAFLRKRDLEFKSLDLNQTVMDVIRLVTGDAVRRHVRISHQLDRTLPLIRGDEVQLQHVLVNLIVNAMDSMAETPEDARRIDVKTTMSQEGLVEVSVQDSGAGLPKGSESRLFESFYTTKPEGMGLGLSIARAIVNAHQGQISAQDNPVVGATFRVALPPSDADM